jgi:GNAT superfamily N-acetyltransferase
LDLCEVRFFGAREGPTIYVHHFDVLPKHRGKRIGIIALDKFLRSFACVTVAILVADAGEARGSRVPYKKRLAGLIRHYKRIGFKPAPKDGQILVRDSAMRYRTDFRQKGR